MEIIDRIATNQEVITQHDIVFRATKQEIGFILTGLRILRNGRLSEEDTAVLTALKSSLIEARSACITSAPLYLERATPEEADVLFTEDTVVKAAQAFRNVFIHHTASVRRAPEERATPEEPATPKSSEVYVLKVYEGKPLKFGHCSMCEYLPICHSVGFYKTEPPSLLCKYAPLVPIKE